MIEYDPLQEPPIVPVLVLRCWFTRRELHAVNEKHVAHEMLTPGVFACFGELRAKVVVVDWDGPVRVAYVGKRELIPFMEFLDDDSASSSDTDLCAG